MFIECGIGTDISSTHRETDELLNLPFEFVITSNSLEKLTAHFIILVVNHLLQDPTEVQREPTEGKDEDETEDSFGHLSSLQRDFDTFHSTIRGEMTRFV